MLSGSIYLMVLYSSETVSTLYEFSWTGNQDQQTTKTNSPTPVNGRGLISKILVPLLTIRLELKDIDNCFSTSCLQENILWGNVHKQKKR